MLKKFILWAVILVGLAGALFGLTKILSTPPTKPPATQAVKGETNAKVTLIEYSDFQCPACAAYYPVVKQLTQEFGQNIYFTYRYFPLSSIHKNARISSQAAEASGKQGKFWEMHDLLFENQNEWSNLPAPKEKFKEYAKFIGLDMEKFQNDLESKEVKERIESDYSSGLSLGVNATPTFFLNGVKLQNPKSYEEFKAKIEEFLK
ncbi:DsbA family protein [Candidatus Daviesbacteria bacterium]|nr:DsbA family protein [Candidatus Daviesbacteria bacterium]